MTVSRSSGKLILPVLALSQIAASLMAIVPSTSSAHGSMVNPPSREYACNTFDTPWNNPTYPSCGKIASLSGSWMSNAQGGVKSNHKDYVKDGLLCAGGKQDWKALDAADFKGRVTSVTPDAQGKAVFEYKQTAGHISSYFKTYISKDSYDPKRGLRWDDLELIGDSGKLPRPENNSITKLAVKIPAHLTGKRVVYSVWQRDPSDNAEAFYACSDVDVVANNIEWKASGALEGGQVNTGVTLTLRVFDKVRGGDLEQHSIVVAKGQEKPEQWMHALATKTNLSSGLVRVGKLIGSEIKPQFSASENQVFGRNQQVSFAIDQHHGGTNPPDDIAPGKVTVSGKAEAKAGEVVSLSAAVAVGTNLKYLWTVSPSISGLTLNTSTLNFKAPELKQDTAYSFTVNVSNALGSQSGKHNLTVKAKEDGATPPPAEGIWDAKKVYNKICTKVSHKGKVWMNGWWIQGKEPGSDGVWGVWRVVGAPEMHSDCKEK
ncbi:hypothetical protein HA052_25945 [Chromobacterium haemolyticum]|uniref:Chitin-binding type-3 domain-containing protein n=1 Tax=Chromobacterium fluminis TaxID=3044269 RepID=A0ABX0LGL8_9NEIS|nr:lytic polysaccharide monooxygenase [Chromobacterium haemolyticum]NHR08637.1 hypothetical protein [Chromobacterium haemolyticum]